MGSLREAACDRDWLGGPRLPYLLPSTRARGAPPRVEPPVSYGVSARGRLRSGLAGGAAFTLPVALYARARRAATGRAACELWGLCARPPAIGIGWGAPRYLTCYPLARARRAATGEPPVSYGVLARGRLRSGLAGGSPH